MAEQPAKSVLCTCGKSFRTETSGRKHVRASSRHAGPAPAPTTPTADPHQPAEDEKTMKCTCGHFFLTARGMAKHVRESARHVAVEEALRPAAASGTASSVKQWRCRCGSVFATLKDLHRHVAAAPDHGRYLRSEDGSWMDLEDYRGIPGLRVVWPDGEGMCYDDVGVDDHLCEEECGSCGHCADFVD